ncbi:aminodeoxychorismate lyase [Aeromonas cavernicola]|uniref:Aminodeoxychorismate lyase n=1 Tax=Aeromonas cavernicola TaxID=1006623 RepID=A0A2H9U489_9GAMM|nr:aminodeoxychorismate lyase [Aeromonas cavernicola]PJG58852.1 aminodeoxychorismate lyase [Aeromonas cavernicola]
MLINGMTLDTISAHDRGLAYGDGHFTTMAVKEGRVLQWAAHLARLQQGCQRLGMVEPDWHQLTQELEQLVVGEAQCVAKVILTRGEGGRGYDGSGCQQTTRILSLAPFPTQYASWRHTGINMMVCRQRIGDAPMLAGLKTLNRLEQVLLKNELVCAGAVEGVVLSSRGVLVEAVSANLFWRRGKTVFTPDLNRCGIDGIMRRQIMAMLKQMGIELRVVEAPLESLWQAEEVWLTNTLMGVVPINSIDDMHYPAPELSRRLQERLALEV